MDLTRLGRDLVIVGLELLRSSMDRRHGDHVERIGSLRGIVPFLRTRRERMTPKLAGLPESGRRRTPGLRRSEVALLADVGLDWYTYLEQGRHINVSAEVLDRIAGALQLGESERRHLFHLARKQFPLIEIEKPLR